MILSDRDIRMFLSTGSISIEPFPPEAAYSSTSLDLRLDGELRCFRHEMGGGCAIFDPSAPGYVFEKAISEVTEPRCLDENGFDLAPQAMVLGWTIERIGLDVMSRIAARVEGKSSLARIGLAIHITAPTIHAGFRGAIQLEIVNHGPLPVRLRKGMKICQLIFEQALSVPQRGYDGQFQDQRSAVMLRRSPMLPVHKSPVHVCTGPCERRAVPGGA
jgi:dCTP deaminase